MSNVSEPFLRVSSDEEFGGYDPITPRKPSRTTKPNSKVPTAGPSAPVSAPANKRRRAPKSAPVAEVTVISASEDQAPPSHDGDVVEAPKSKSKGKSKAKKGMTSDTAESAALNGADKSKGKTNAQPPPKEKQRQRPSPEPMDIVDFEIPEAITHIRTPLATGARLKQDQSSKELAKLQERFKQIEAENKELAAQLGTLAQLKPSESTKALEEQARVYSSQIQTQERLIYDLTSRLARVESSVGASKSSILEFFSREAVEDEKKTLDKEVAKWKSVVKEKDVVIAQKNERIADIEQRLKEAQIDLKAEIERAKTLASKAASHSSSKLRQPELHSENVKITKVLRLYEDATNLLVTNVRYQKGNYFDLEDCILTCIYTYINENDLASVDKQGKSLSFTLRLFYDVLNEGITEVTSQDQLCKSVHYIPLDLDKEGPEFVEKLDFLGIPFTFPRHQLPLFMSQIYERMEEATSSNANGEVDMEK